MRAFPQGRILRRVQSRSELRARLRQVRQLVRMAHERYERNLEIYRTAEATSRRLREKLNQSRILLRQQGARRVSRLRRLLIISRIEEGRLPDATLPIVSGAPGFGGACDACDGYLPPTQMVMMIPNGDDTFAFLHTECYLIWNAQVHLRAALRHIA